MHPGNFKQLQCNGRALLYLALLFSLSPTVALKRNEVPLLLVCYGDRSSKSSIVVAVHILQTEAFNFGLTYFKTQVIYHPSHLKAQVSRQILQPLSCNETAAPLRSAISKNLSTVYMAWCSGSRADLCIVPCSVKNFRPK